MGFGYMDAFPSLSHALPYTLDMSTHYICWWPITRSALWNQPCTGQSSSKHLIWTLRPIAIPKDLSLKTVHRLRRKTIRWFAVSWLCSACNLIRNSITVRSGYVGGGPTWNSNTRMVLYGNPPILKMRAFYWWAVILVLSWIQCIFRCLAMISSNPGSSGLLPRVFSISLSFQISWSGQVATSILSYGLEVIYF